MEEETRSCWPPVRSLLLLQTTKLLPDAIDVHMVEQHLHDKKGIPPVDLIIRTGNDYRTSNFLPWLANGHESCRIFLCPLLAAFQEN